MLLTWLYLSSLAILLGAELNAEIEHASPYGKAVGERVEGERRRIGIAAERYHRKRLASGDLAVRPFPDDVNCDLDVAPKANLRLRTSDLLIGTAALLPWAISDRARGAKDRTQRIALPRLPSVRA